MYYEFSVIVCLNMQMRQPRKLQLPCCKSQLHWLLQVWRRWGSLLQPIHSTWRQSHRRWAGWREWGEGWWKVWRPLSVRFWLLFQVNFRWTYCCFLYSVIYKLNIVIIFVTVYMFYISNELTWASFWLFEYKKTKADKNRAKRQSNNQISQVK